MVTFLITIGVILFTIWYYFFYPIATPNKKFSKQHREARQIGDRVSGPIYRALDLDEGNDLSCVLPNKIDPSKPLETLYELFEHSHKLFKDEPCLGYRPLIKEFLVEKEIDGEKKMLSFPQLGPYQWFTYGEVHERCDNFASGLRHLGLQSKGRLAIFEDTRMEWTITQRAAFMQNYTLFTVYANLGIDALVIALNQGEIKYIVSNGALINTLISIKEKVPSLEYIVYTDKEKVTEDAIVKAQKFGLQLFPFEEIEIIGKNNRYEHVPPSPEDLACIMYTSGSTGVPKGVMTSHKNIVAAVQGTLKILRIEKGDTILHYLPLAHSFANMLESILLYHGVKLGIGSPRTLSSNGVKNCDGDLKTLGPNLFIAVPTIFEKIKHGIMFNVNQKGPISKILFHIAYTQKLRSMKNGRTGKVWDIILKKVRDHIGIKKMKYMVTGSAPLSGEMQDFARVIFNCPLIQGYGLTETVSAGTVQRVEDFSNENIGACVHSTEIKLVDVPEMKYLNTDKPYPRGEIWIRGPTVTCGYYKEKEKTDEAFIYEDDSKYPWFATGDIGLWLDTGCLKIVDRKKNLIKPPHGEYIALEKLESVYKNCTYLDLICVYVDSEHFDCVAILTPNRDRVTAWAVSQKLPEADDWNKLCASPKLKDFILHDLKNTGRRLKLRSIETVRNITLCPEEWTPQNTMLTSAMKLNRGEIVKKYRKEIDAMYKEISKD